MAGAGGQDHGTTGNDVRATTIRWGHASSQDVDVGMLNQMVVTSDFRRLPNLWAWLPVLRCQQLLHLFNLLNLYPIDGLLLMPGS